MNYYDNKEYVSNSMLNWLDISPKYLLYKLKRNSEEVETKALENGKLLHSYIEDPSKFIVSEIENPGGKTGDFLEAYAKVKDVEKAKEMSNMGYTVKKLTELLEDKRNRDYLNFIQLSEGKIALTRDQKIAIDGAIASLHSNKYSADLLFTDPLMHESKNELEVYFESIVNRGTSSVKRKAKLDKVTIDHVNKVIKVTDLKTTTKNAMGKFYPLNNQVKTGFIQKDYYYDGWFASFINFGYYRQAAYYVDAVKHIYFDLIDKGYTVEFYFIVVRLDTSFDVAVYRTSQATLNYGHSDVNNLLNKYRSTIIDGIDHNQEIYEI